MNIRKVLLIVAVACAFAAVPVIAGTRHVRYASTPSHLVIHRAANFGTFISVNIYIDGQYAGNVAYNHGFDVVVPAGSHVVTLEQTPRRGAALQVTQQRIEVGAGGSSVFTVVSTDGGTRAVLRPS